MTALSSGVRVLDDLAAVEDCIYTTDIAMETEARRLRYLKQSGRAHRRAITATSVERQGQHP